jgi:hypothetical protein
MTCRGVALALSLMNPSARAVSSVVEHLVYTERVGGSKPSPPSLQKFERDGKNNFLPFGVGFGGRMQSVGGD